MQKWLEDRTIYFARHGSHAYGTNIATSDEDFKGVCIPPKNYYIGFLDTFEQAESSKPDKVVYEIRKFFKLAADCNPSIIEVLFVDDKDVIKKDYAGRLLRLYREKFLSTKAKHTFSGYAHSQLKRIKTHRSWIMDPPKAPPKRSDFGLPEQNKVSKSDLGAFESLQRDGVSLDENVMYLFYKERQYVNAQNTWNQYQNWLATRNEARAALERKFGYDTKHAMHLVRLMRMCREILETGEVIVKRPDAKDLLAIREGAWSYDRLVEWAEAEDADLEEVAKKSPLRKAPDRVWLNDLCMEIIDEYS